MSTMQFQFNTDSSVMGTHEVAARAKHGADDKHCTIEARPRGARPIGVTGKAADVDAAARIAANTMAERLERVLGRAARHRRDPSPDKQF